MNIELFKKIISEQEFDPVDIVRKHLIYGEPFFYKDSLDQYYNLKDHVARQFDTHPHNVIMVGSAKLGFSIAPQKLWQAFHDESDIDIVIISESVFTKYWSRLFLFNENTSHDKREAEQYAKFKDYFFRGWIRPDLFSYKYPDKNQWFDFFKESSLKFGNGRKISCAIYYRFDFFEKYHANNIEQIRKLELGL